MGHPTVGFCLELSLFERLFVDHIGHGGYNDPYIAQLHKMRKHDFSHLSSVSIEDDQLSRYDCVVIVTDHDDYDYEKIVAGSPLVVDTRNATRRVTAGKEKVRYC